jgi:8-oxo-dGTP pyrophosphatase MutT (NUDIX family)
MPEQSSDESERSPDLAVAVIVEDHAGRVLLLKRAEGRTWGGHWCFPGGRVRKGETLAEACVRELAEETGLVTWEDSLRRVGLTEVIDGDGHLIGVVFRCPDRSGGIVNREPERHSDIKFFDWSELPSPLMPGVAQWVRSRLRGGCG